MSNLDKIILLINNRSGKFLFSSGQISPDLQMKHLKDKIDGFYRIKFSFKTSRWILRKDKGLIFKDSTINKLLWSDNSIIDFMTDLNKENQFIINEFIIQNSKVF